jgi:hypothetical protein
MKFKMPSKAERAFWWEDTHVIRQRVYVGIYVVFVGFLLIGAWIGNRTAPVTVKDTAIGTTQSLGGMNSIMVRLDKAVYDSKHKTMLVNITGSNSNDVVMTGAEIKVAGDLVSGSARVATVPTTNNSWTILVRDMPETWGAVEVKIIPNAPTDPTQKALSGTSSTAKFNMTQNGVKKVSNLTNLSGTKIAADAVQTQINKLQKSIKKTQDDVKKTQAVIKYDENQAQKLQTNFDSLTYDEKADVNDSVAKVNQDIDTQKAAIDSLNKKIANKQKKLSQLEDKLASVKSGEFKLPDDTETGILKQKKAK